MRAVSCVFLPLLLLLLQPAPRRARRPRGGVARPWRTLRRLQEAAAPTTRGWRRRESPRRRSRLRVSRSSASTLASSFKNSSARPSSSFAAGHFYARVELETTASTLRGIAAPRTAREQAIARGAKEKRFLEVRLLFVNSRKRKKIERRCCLSLNVE